ncbi:MAG: DnaJ domain-containing protein [Alphaproteobacteria bacterium]|nr:DnaJ domain-containing protein [Alphaproteobacteria bacterium]
MPYLLLAIGLLVGLYVLYRFFVNADVHQVKAFFLMSILVIICVALFTLAFTGRLPAALAILAAIAPLAAGWWKARKDSEEEPDLFFNEETEINSREKALQVLGLDTDATEADIRQAYKKLMQKLHPDHEGSEWIAAKLNEARDFLLKN